MYTKFPPRLARFAFLLGLAGLAVCALVVFPLQWLSLKAEASVAEVSGAYATRSGEEDTPAIAESTEPTSEPTSGPSPKPSPAPTPVSDSYLAKQAGGKTVKILTPVFVLVGFTLVCFLIEIATGPRSGA
ncbi:MAG: hypothetical protein QM758_14960 [Armatimonas sp.]